MLTKLKIKKLTTTNIFYLKKQRYSTKSNKNIAVLLSMESKIECYSTNRFDQVVVGLEMVPR